MEEKFFGLELKNIEKSFGDVKANQNISLQVKQGEILSILGENGSGKSTLMNIIAGIYQPDAGDIYIKGDLVHIASPKDAFRYGVGMVHQHFHLIDIFTAAENIILGLKEEGGYKPKKVEEKIRKICKQYGFLLSPSKKVYAMSVSEKQMVEIVKVLYRGAEILILDEPTAVLTPQETQALFSVLRKMRDDGKTILIITHKLQEVMEISDRVTVIRGGKIIQTVETRKTSQEELTELMVGHKTDLHIHRAEVVKKELRLDVKHLDLVKNNQEILKDISFEVYDGEILGIAGISGSGQKELLEAIAGLEKVSQGDILYTDPTTGEKEQLQKFSADAIRKMGVRLSFVPEDRLGMGLVGNMDLVDNLLLRSYNESNDFFINREEPRKLAKDLVEKLNISTPDIYTPLRQLSGGNIQKVLVGREITIEPALLMVAYPVRGLDIHSSYQIYDLLNEEKKKGVAIIYVGEDLDVMLELCDRILVLADGMLSGLVDARRATKEEIGLLMTQTQAHAFVRTDKGEE